MAINGRQDDFHEKVNRPLEGLHGCVIFVVPEPIVGKAVTRSFADPYGT